MTQFRNQPWNQRFKQMGDEAENIFEHVASTELGIGYARYGLARPPLNVAQLPPFIRYTPDYITSSYLVEVQGSGRDEIVKLKQDKLEALHLWAAVFPVKIFLWDRENGRWTLQEVGAFDTLCATSAGFFDETKPWYGWTVSFFDGWVPLDED